MVDLPFLASKLSRWLLTATSSAVIFTILPKHSLQWVGLAIPLSHIAFLVILLILAIWAITALNFVHLGWRAIDRDNQGVVMIAFSSMIAVVVAFFVAI